jgi:hypothetical protein
MNESESLEAAISSIEDALSVDLKAHQAAAIGRQLHKLQSRADLAMDRRIGMLVNRYFTLLSSWGLEDLLQRQTDYAIVLASAEGELEYEEIHKLFSLCDEISALESLGLKHDIAQRSRFESAVRKRFSDQSRVAELVAEDRGESGGAGKWWFPGLSS